MTNQPPKRTWQYDALEAFLGEWRAEGTSYGGTDQSGSDPRANGESWVSRHRAYWHTGSFFMVQDERAVIAGRAFDTLEVGSIRTQGTISLELSRTTGSIGTMAYRSMA